MDIISKAYYDACSGLKDEWFSENGGDNWYNHIVNLPIHQKVIYTVVVMHNQVFNGGFDQYFSNGYGHLFAPEAIKSLELINAVEEARLLKQAFDIVNYKNLSDTEFRYEYFNGFDWFRIKEIIDKLEELDKLYYNIEGIGEITNIEILLKNYLEKLE